MARDRDIFAFRQNQRRERAYQFADHVAAGVSTEKEVFARASPPAC